MFYVLKGLLIGLSIAAPVGPIGLLCIRRTLAYGRLSGLLSGLGAATADMFYSIIAGFGLTAISTFLLHGKVALSLIGGLFLCYLGIKTLTAKPASHTAEVKHTNILKDYLSTLGLTITNPLTVLSFLAIFAGIGIEAGNYTSATILVLGVFMGSALWWVFLVIGVGLFRKKITPTFMLWIDRIAGMIIFIFGLLSLGRLL